MTGDCRASRGDVGAAHVHQLAVAEDAGPGEIEEHADTVRRALGDRHHFVDAVGALRAGVDERGDALREANPRHLGRARVRVDVDETGHDQLPGGIDDRPGARSSDVGLHGRDAASADGDVRDPIEPARRVDHPSAFDENVENVQVVGGLRREVRAVRKPHQAGGRRRAEEIPSGQHMQLSRGPYELDVSSRPYGGYRAIHRSEWYLTTSCGFST